MHMTCKKVQVAKCHLSRYPTATLHCSKLILAPAILSYSGTAFFSAMSKRRNMTTLIPAAYADTFAVRRPANGIPCRIGLGPSSLTLRNGDSEHSCQTDSSIAKDPECFPFTCTTAVRLWYKMQTHIRNSSSNTTVYITRQKPVIHPVKCFELIQTDQHGLGVVFYPF